jgi:hypothetical protein
MEQTMAPSIRKASTEANSTAGWTRKFDGWLDSDGTAYGTDDGSLDSDRMDEGKFDGWLDSDGTADGNDGSL